MFYPTDAQFGSVKSASVPNGGKFMALVGTRFETQHDENGEEIKGGKYLVDPPPDSTRFTADKTTLWATANRSS